MKKAARAAVKAGDGVGGICACALRVVLIVRICLRLILLGRIRVERETEGRRAWGSVWGFDWD